MYIKQVRNYVAGFHVAINTWRSDWNFSESTYESTSLDVGCRRWLMLDQHSANGGGGMVNECVCLCVCSGRGWFPPVVSDQAAGEVLGEKTLTASTTAAPTVHFMEQHSSHTSTASHWLGPGAHCTCNTHTRTRRHRVAHLSVPNQCLLFDPNFTLHLIFYFAFNYSPLSRQEVPRSRHVSDVFMREVQHSKIKASKMNTTVAQLNMQLWKVLKQT